MVSADRLGWYVQRLRGMSPAEVVSRVGDQGRRRRWAGRQVLPGGPVPRPADLRPDRAFTAVLPPGARDAVPPGAAAARVAAADRVLDGTWTVLGTVRADSADPDWFRDPLTGRRAPDRQLAFRINHRDEAVTGNVKQVWELSRHHHLTVLAAAWWLTGDERYARATADQLRSWWQANPFLSGVHWTSGIEAGIRLVSWVWIRRLLADWPKVGDLFEDDPHAVAQIAWHAEFLAGFRSTGSSANNHVIAEAAGGLAAACAFDWYGRSAGWRRDAASLLEAELAANTFPSGLNRELASEYHYLVADLALLALAEADVAGHPLPEGAWLRLAAILDAGAAVLDAHGGPPRQGDGDSGRALVVDDPERERAGVVLGAGAAVVGPAPWWPEVDGGVQGVLLGALLGDRRRVDPARRPRERPRRFADAGLVLLRSRPSDGPEIWCRADVGPHGFLSICAHAHADALSVEVRHDGVDVLADPGTYCYHGEPAWRAWFRSTAGHNTLQLGGVDQAVSRGPFLWTTHPVTTTLACELGDLPLQRLTAEHDGYRRLEIPAVHRRELTLDSPARALTVVDTVLLDRPGEVDLLLPWHLGPAVRADLDGASARLSWQVGGAVRQGLLTLPGHLTWTAHRGQEDPVAGWFSPGFGVREPSTVLLGRGRIAGTTALTLTTSLVLDRVEDPSAAVAPAGIAGPPGCSSS